MLQSGRRTDMRDVTSFPVFQKYAISLQCLFAWDVKLLPAAAQSCHDK